MREKFFFESVKSQIAETSIGPVEFADVGSGEPVVVVHGGPGGWDQGIGMGRMFADAGFRLIAFSRPGYLRTPIFIGQTVSAQADVIAALLDYLKLDKAAILGASAGGPPAYEFAMRYPGRTKALIAVDAISRPYKIPEQAGQIEQMIFLSKPGEWLLNKFAEYFPGLAVGAILKTEGYLNSKELKARVKSVINDPVKLEFARTMIASMNHYDQRRAGVENDLKQYENMKTMDLGVIKAPSLIIHGTADADVQFSDADYAASTIPDAEHFWINRGTHLCFWLSAQADEAQKRAIDFLKKYSNLNQIDR